MMMRTSCGLAVLLSINLAAGFRVYHPSARSWTSSGLQMASNNVDLFSSDTNPFTKMRPNKTENAMADTTASSTPAEVTQPIATPIVTAAIPTTEAKPSLVEELNTVVKKDDATSRMMDAASRLRKEAAEMEVALLQEARDKGVPEDLIKQFMPTRAPTKKPVEVEVKKERLAMTSQEVRSKLGYLPIGDAVRMTSELDRMKAKDILELWNSVDPTTAKYSMSVTQLKSKTNIDPVSLKLDDVGFKYQNVFVAALAIGTVLALGSSTIGGEVGFILGYLSALFPIAVVGLGSIAPALIGEIINKSRMVIDSEAKERYVAMNAGRILAGYILGLPVSSHSTGPFSSGAEFFQIRPKGSGSPAKDQRMFSKSQFSQADISRSSVLCLAGAVAECLAFGEASGTNALDVNILYELVNSVEPALSPEKVQDHIRWSAVAAHDILAKNKEALERVKEACRAQLPLEECIAAIEGSKAETEMTQQI